VAEDQKERSREDLTEEASPHRLEEYRRRGIVSQSRELTALTAFLASGSALYAMCPQMGHQLAQFMKDVFRADLTAHADLGSSTVLGRYLIQALRVTASVGLPVCIAGFISGVSASFGQIGSIFH
jgi:flagellar biosynthetic protein FlhB